jgi:hypothetical protein
MQTRSYPLEVFVHDVLPLILDCERSERGEYGDFETWRGNHPTFGRLTAIQGVTSCVLVVSER